MKITLRTFLLAALPALVAAQKSRPRDRMPARVICRPRRDRFLRWPMRLAFRPEWDGWIGIRHWRPRPLQHCQRMAAEGPISHQYGGEQDLTARDGGGWRALQRD